MPIYEFKCQSCEKIFEFLCFPSDGDGDITCPSCGGRDTEKLLSAFSCISSGSNESLGGSAASPSCAPTCAHSGGFS